MKTKGSTTLTPGSLEAIKQEVEVSDSFNNFSENEQNTSSASLQPMSTVECIAAGVSTADQCLEIPAINPVKPKLRKRSNTKKANTSVKRVVLRSEKSGIKALNQEKTELISPKSLEEIKHEKEVSGLFNNSENEQNASSVQSMSSVKYTAAKISTADQFLKTIPVEPVVPKFGKRPKTKKAYIPVKRVVLRSEKSGIKALYQEKSILESPESLEEIKHEKEVRVLFNNSENEKNASSTSMQSMSSVKYTVTEVSSADQCLKTSSVELKFRKRQKTVHTSVSDYSEFANNIIDQSILKFVRANEQIPETSEQKVFLQKWIPSDRLVL